MLADGAGGHGGGDIASRLSVQSVLNDFMADPEVSAPALDALMRNANQSVLLEQQRAGAREPVVLLLHMASPRVQYTDRGKSAVVIAGRVGDEEEGVCRRDSAC